MLKYDAFIFKQVDKAPVQLSFVATSADVDRWAKVPTKLARKPTAFQRPAIESHVAEVREFFTDSTKTNASPTALIVGCEPESQYRIQILEHGSNKPFPIATVGQTPVLCSVQLDFEPWSSSRFSDIDTEIEALYAEVRAMYESPIESEPAQPIAASEEMDVSDDELEVEDDDDDEVDDAEERESLPEGESPNASTTEIIPPAPLSKKDELAEHREFFHKLSAAELASICRDKTYIVWPRPKKEYLRELLRDDRKIGLIIDGQHRVKGSADETVPFIISFLPNASWAELAFQFIVNNGSAKKVSEGLLISIVGDSLTSDQLKSIETRLYRARIKVSLIKAVMRIHEGDNPFQGMLRFRVPGEKGFLDAPAMEKKVVLLWHGDRDKNGRGRLAKVKIKDRHTLSMKILFIANCEGTTLTEKIEDWQRDKWFRYFSAFWSAVSEHFKPRLWPQLPANWPPSSGIPGTAADRERLKLMGVTILGILQTAVLSAWMTDELKVLKKKKAPVKKELILSPIAPEEFKQKISELIRFIPNDFFGDLVTVGFDGSDSLRVDLRRQMLSLLEAHKEFPEIKASHAFWKKSS